MNTLEKLIPLIHKNLGQIIELRDQKVLKNDNSYVSRGDLFLDSLISQFVEDNYRNYFLLSEETYLGGTIPINQFEYIIVVDPIDGTENFVSGLKEWGVGVSVYVNNTHQESIIVLPELDEYIINGKEFERFNSRIVGLSSSLNKQQIMDVDPSYEYRIIGCCMYNMLQVIKGSFISFQNPKGANVWDVLPGFNLALEHNLDVIVENKKYNGEFLQPTQKYRFQIRNI